jgi:hypothetical protein
MQLKKTSVLQKVIFSLTFLWYMCVGSFGSEFQIIVERLQSSSDGDKK